MKLLTTVFFALVLSTASASGNPRGYCVDDAFCYLQTDDLCAVSERSFERAREMDMERIIPKDCMIWPMYDMLPWIKKVKEIDVIEPCFDKDGGTTTVSGSSNENNDGRGNESRTRTVSVTHTSPSGNVSVSGSYSRTDSTGGGSSSTVSGSVTVRW